MQQGEMPSVAEFSFRKHVKLAPTTSKLFCKSSAGMRIILLLLIKSVIVNGGSHRNREPDMDKSDSEVAINGLSGLIRELHTRIDQHCIIFCGGQDISSKMIKKTFSNDFTTIEVMDIEKLSPRKSKMRSAWIFSESAKTFSSCLQKITPSSFDFGGFFIIYLKKESESELEQMFGQMWAKFLVNVAVVTPHENLLLLQTFIPFKAANSCNDTKPKIVSRFVNGTWTSSDFFPEKFSTLHGCPMKISAVESLSIVTKVKSKNGSVALDGIEIKLVQEIGKSLNFTAKIECFEKEHGLILDDKQIFTGNLRHVITGEHDMILGAYHLQLYRAKHMSQSQTYRMDYVEVVSARDQPYSPLEKLLRPFSVWLSGAILTMMLVGFLCIACLQKLKLDDPSVQQLNLFAAFLGVSQYTLPQRGHLRILFGCFAAVCIVLRTIYVGGLFRLMQIEDIKLGISTIDEMVDSKFSFIVGASFGQSTKDMAFHSR